MLSLAIPDAPTEQDRIPDGEHLWVVLAAFRVDPAGIRPGWPTSLHPTNLVKVDEPACFHCEQDYSAEIAALPCPGEPDV